MTEQFPGTMSFNNTSAPPNKFLTPHTSVTLLHRRTTQPHRLDTSSVHGAARVPIAARHFAFVTNAVTQSILPNTCNEFW